MIALFLNKSKAQEATVKLPLMPAGKYKLRSVISGKELGILDKSDWARGVAVKFPDAEPVEVLEVIAVRG